MTRTYKMTTFSKFIIFLIIAAPLSYIGASYYNGQDPFEKIKNLNIFNSSPANNDDIIKTQSTNESSLIKELELKDLEIDQLNIKIKKLEEVIETQKSEIDNLKNSKNL